MCRQGTRAVDDYLQGLLQRRLALRLVGGGQVLRLALQLVVVGLLLRLWERPHLAPRPALLRAGGLPVAPWVLAAREQLA